MGVYSLYKGILKFLCYIVSFLNPLKTFTERKVPRQVRENLVRNIRRFSCDLL